ncbi:MAG: hypothetical protein QW292_11740 [Candidatus Parvarchaeota archaeon]
MKRRYDVLVVTLLAIIAIGQLALDAMYVSLRYGKSIDEWGKTLAHGNLSVGSIIFYVLVTLFFIDVAKIITDRKKKKVKDDSYVEGYY